MRLAILFSGGKDSNYALYKTLLKNHKVVCLITMKPLTNESYMFQQSGIEFTKLQSKCLEIPIRTIETKGEKELELNDLKHLIQETVKEFNIEGIVTGAIRSAYQTERIQKICNDLDLWCFNPLWQIDEEVYLNQLIKEEFDIRIVSIASYPLTEEIIGEKIDSIMSRKLGNLAYKYKISPIGEGGEFETFVCDSPLYKKRIIIKDSEKILETENSGYLKIKIAKLEDK